MPINMQTAVLQYNRKVLVNNAFNLKDEEIPPKTSKQWECVEYRLYKMQLFLVFN